MIPWRLRFAIQSALIWLRRWSREGASPMDPATGRARFAVSGNGVITDSSMGLEWVESPTGIPSYKSAEAWVKGCNIADGGWRMPTREELRGLYIKGMGACNRDTAFKTKGWRVWAEPQDSSSEGGFYFRAGGGYWDASDDHNYYSYDNNDGIPHVFAVRALSRR